MPVNESWFHFRQINTNPKLSRISAPISFVSYIGFEHTKDINITKQQI